MFDDFDSEERYRLACGALEGLTSLVEHQRPDEGVSSERLGALMRVVTETVKAMMPNGNPLHPAAMNDED